MWTVALSQFGPGWPLRNVAAEFLSTSALILASTNLMLSTRIRPFEGAFGGLDKMYTSHRLNGMAVALLVASHFLLMRKTAPFAPGGILGFTALALFLGSVFAATAPRAPWRRLVPLRYQEWKLLHRTMGLVVLIAVAHSFLVPKFVRALPLMLAWVYGFVLLGLLAYVYREAIEGFAVRRHRYRVAHPEQLSPDVFEVQLEPVAHPIRHRPGQFAFVSLEDGPSREQHPFTMSAAPAGGALRFSIKASGDFTLALQSHVPDGSLASIEGPYGRFDFTKAGPRQLWLAGGIGITPFLAFAPTLDGSRDVRLVWAVHDTGDAVHGDELKRVADAGVGLDLTVHVTSESGRLKLADLGLTQTRGLDVYICGPIPMRKAFVAELRALGVPRDRIRFEEFSLR